MRAIILGGGLAGLSLAHYINCQSVIIEKEEIPGGLCRSFSFNGIFYDIGPHILFSRDQEMLAAMLQLMDTATIRRSSRVLHKGRLVKYPFENDLAALAPEERDYCLNGFLRNPYEGYEAKNMLQFFLKTFGEGITRLYLQPYNEKIWKFDPAYMDTQMVARIPKPPAEDIIKSAKGIPTEGYTHQLYFQYPRTGGIQSLIKGYLKLIAEKSEVLCGTTIQRITKRGDMWSVSTNKGTVESPLLINCMPLHELFRYLDAPKEVVDALGNLKYNSIHIIIVQVKKAGFDSILSINVADKDILFHRVTHINFLGERYCLPGGGSTIMAEITYRPGSHDADLPAEEIKQRVVRDLAALDIISKEDVLGVEIRSFPYAYVIYDLNHRSDTDLVLSYLSSRGIESAGRFACFEYLNMDAVVAGSKRLAADLNERFRKH